MTIATIPWKQLYGMRNRIVHGYSGVDMKIVWDTISEDLPVLKQEMERYLWGDEWKMSNQNNIQITMSDKLYNDRKLAEENNDESITVQELD